MLTIKDLTITYPDKTVAIEGLNLTVAQGERVALIGANGAGKTSLLLSLVGVLPHTGTVLLDRLPLDKKTVRDFRARVGMVFQNPDDQLFMPTIADDVAFGPRNQGIPEDEIAQRVTDTLTQLGIAHLRERTALKLSGGEKRMAALATVLSMQPSMLLLDEPTAFLDPRARRTLIRALRPLAPGMLIATHDLSFAVETCPRCVLLRDRRVFADGASRELLYDKERMEECGLEAIGVMEMGGKI